MGGAHEKGGRAGFTLVEVMVVVVIIGILATAATLHFKDKVNIARERTTRMSISTLRVAASTYEMEIGEYPKTLDELTEEGDENWPGPFIEDEEVPKDGWGTKFKYEIRGKRFRITSAGRDRKFKTEDDLWK